MLTSAWRRGHLAWPAFQDHAGHARPPGPAAWHQARSGPPDWLRVVVQLELVRVRPEPDGVNLVTALVVEPGLDQVRGKHAALEQELVIGLEVVEHCLERARNLGDGLGLVWRQLVEVLVDRLWRLDLVLDAVQPGHHHGRERKS